MSTLNIRDAVIDDAALILLCSIASITLVVLAFLFRPLVLECADPQFLRSVSRMSAPTHFVFLSLVVLNLVAGFQALGTLMAVGIMILPMIASLCDDALRSVPESLRHGAYSLGATSFEVSTRIVIPAALSGIFVCADVMAFTRLPCTAAA